MKINKAQTYMTAVFDGPEVVFLLALLATRFLCRPWAVVLVVGRVLQLVVAAGTDNDQVLVGAVFAPVGACVAGEARPGRRWGLEVGLGRGLPPAVTTKAISLVVELGRVACEGVGVHRKGGHGHGSNKLDVSLSGVVDGLGEKTWEQTTYRSYQVAAKVLVLGAMCGGSGGGSSSRSRRGRGWQATVVAVSTAVSRLVSVGHSWRGRQPAVGGDVVVG